MLRTAALVAAIAHILVEAEVYWPAMFGNSSSLAGDPGIPLWLSFGTRAFMDLALLFVYVMVCVVASQILVPALLKTIAVWSAVAIGLQNVPFAVANIRALVFRSQDVLGWQYHPLRQLWYVLSPLVFTLWVVITILSLIGMGLRPVNGSGSTLAAADPEGRREAALRAAGVLAALAAAGQLVGALYVVFQLRVLTFRAMLQIIIDASLAVFFVVMSRCHLNTEAIAYHRSEPA